MPLLLRLQPPVPHNSMRLTTISLAAILLLAPTLLRAQASSNGVEALGSARLEALGDSLARSGALALPLGDRGSFTYLLVHRDTTGEVEVHRDWADVMVVRAGAATVETGGTLGGGRETAPGETRGGGLRGAEPHSIAVGDVLVIPAGIPHRVVVRAGHPVTYLVVKVRWAEATPPTAR